MTIRGIRTSAPLAPSGSSSWWDAYPPEAHPVDVRRELLARQRAETRNRGRR